MNNIKIANELVKIAKLLRASYEEDQKPMVYVSTYAKYNEGGLSGEWVDLDEFDNKQSFYEECRRIHSDETDPEFLMEDYENFPDKYYAPYGLSDQIWSYLKKIKESWMDKEHIDTLIDEGYSLDEVQKFTVYKNCKNDEDLARAFINMQGGFSGIGDQTIEAYFDFRRFGHDLKMEKQDYDDERDDDDYAYDQIYSLGSISLLGDNSIENYFDFERFGRELGGDFKIIKSGDDMLVKFN